MDLHLLDSRRWLEQPSVRRQPVAARRLAGSNGRPPGAVVRTRWDSKDIWLRKTFRVTQVPERVSIDLHHDDEIEVYLNGRLVYETRGYLVAYKRILLPKEAAEALSPGDNVIAVHCHQTTGGQYVDVGLSATSDRELIQTLLLEQGDELLGSGTMRSTRPFAIGSQPQGPLPELGTGSCASPNGDASRRTF